MKYQSKDRKLGTRQNIKMVGDFLDARARTAIDIGCDEGMIAVHLHHLGLKVDAVEAAPDVAEEAKHFIAANQAQVNLTTKILSLDDVNAMSPYDVVCFLSVYHQVVEHTSIEYANQLLVALYRKTRLQFFFQPCMIHLKHRVRMPFVENNTADALAYFTSVLRASGLPVVGQFVGYSLNGLPASDPFRPMFVFEKKKDRVPFEFPAMGRGRITEKTPSRLVYVDIEQTVNAHALQSFGTAGWHHFTEACRAQLQSRGHSVADALEAIESSLAGYYDKFQPANVGEIWRRAGQTSDIGVLALQPTRHRCNWLPWNQSSDPVENMRAGRTCGHEWPAEDCHAYGPISPEIRRREAQRLHGLLAKLTGEGYEPEVNFDGYIRGQLLVRGNDSRFLVTAGQHRIAALATLGYKQIVAKFQPGVARIIDLAEVRQWPQVANGTYTAEQATHIFNGLFEATGAALRDALKTVPKITPISLPPVQAYTTRATFENGWSDQYGALHVAAAHAGLTMPTAYAMNAIWQHGCDGPWLDFSPALLCNNAPQAKSVPVLVARQEQAELLLAHGYPHARAVGLPIVYTKPSGLARMPRSLLVMPTHTLVGDQYPERAAFEHYADEIKAIASGFDRVTICIHPSCRKNGLWISEFTARGFEIVYGAQNTDLNSLARVRALFEQYETVTTNGWGSHVAYALAFGAKVSIYGTQPKRSEADYLRDATWAADKAALKQALSDETTAREQAYLAPLLVPPTQAIADVARGSWLIGAELKLAPQEMAAILGSLMTPSPTATTATSSSIAVVETAREVRTQARLAARELLSAGRRGEAIQALLRAVKIDVASKHPLIIVEALVEIGDDLSMLEPKQSGFLGEQAKKIAQNNGLDLAAIRAARLPANAEAEAVAA